MSHNRWVTPQGLFFKKYYNVENNFFVVCVIKCGMGVWKWVNQEIRPRQPRIRLRNLIEVTTFRRNETTIEVTMLKKTVLHLLLHNMTSEEDTFEGGWYSYCNVSILDGKTSLLGLLTGKQGWKYPHYAESSSCTCEGG